MIAQKPWRLYHVLFRFIRHNTKLAENERSHLSVKILFLFDNKNTTKSQLIEVCVYDHAEAREEDLLFCEHWFRILI